MSSAPLALVIHEPGLRPRRVVVDHLPFVLSDDLPADARLRETRAPVRIAIGRSESGYYARDLRRRTDQGRHPTFRLSHRSIIVAAGVRVRFLTEVGEVRRPELSPAPRRTENPSAGSGAAGVAPDSMETFREGAPPTAPESRATTSRTRTDAGGNGVSRVRELIRRARILEDGLPYALESLDHHPVFGTPDASDHETGCTTLPS